MSTQFVAQNVLLDWMNAPLEHEIANYDDPKMRYRKYVEDMSLNLSTKSLKTKKFITIATNVLCADIQSSDPSLDPVQRDLYLPLEISLTKWSVSQGKIPIEERDLISQTWLLNPGPPTRSSVCAALEHKKLHKIDFKPDDFDNVYVENDISKIVKEINEMLTPDRVVFSQSLKHVRQDLGSLKWLNKQFGYKMKPIKVYALDDLYVVLMNRLHPDSSQLIGSGVARFRLESIENHYDMNLMCDYHQTSSKNEDGDCRYCASALSLSYSNAVVDDVGSKLN